MKNKQTIFVSPNPFNSELSIEIQRQNFKQATITIKNIVGQTVFKEDENNVGTSYSKSIEVSFLPKGIYFIEVMVDGERYVNKMLKE